MGTFKTPMRIPNHQDSLVFYNNMNRSKQSLPLRHQQQQAEGALASSDQQQTMSLPTQRVPNPAPLGLIGFGFTTFLLQIRGTEWVEDDDKDDFDLVLLGFALFFGGLLQVIAGISEIQRNNLFGYTAFCLYGGFWMSIATIDIVKFLATGHTLATSPKALQTALSLLCLCSAMLWALTFKLNKTICVLFFLLTCTCGFLAAGVDQERVHRIGAYLGMITSANAFWLAFAELVNDVYGRGAVEVIPLGHWGTNRGHGGFHFPSRMFGIAHSNHPTLPERKMNCSFTVDGDEKSSP